MEWDPRGNEVSEGINRPSLLDSCMTGEVPHCTLNPHDSPINMILPPLIKQEVGSHNWATRDLAPGPLAPKPRLYRLLFGLLQAATSVPVLSIQSSINFGC